MKENDSAKLTAVGSSWLAAGTMSCESCGNPVAELNCSTWSGSVPLAGCANIVSARATVP